MLGGIGGGGGPLGGILGGKEGGGPLGMLQKLLDPLGIGDMIKQALSSVMQGGPLAMLMGGGGGAAGLGDAAQERGL